VTDSTELQITMGTPVMILGVVRAVFQPPDVRVGFPPSTTPTKICRATDSLNCGIHPGDNCTPYSTRDSTRSYNSVQTGIYNRMDPHRDCHSPNVVRMEECNSEDS
jgi:hypothetical protein